MDYNDIFILLEYSDNRDVIAKKIIDVKGEKLWPKDIRRLLFYPKDKEFIKKTLLQNGVNYKLINDVINGYNENNDLKIPLIPYNYQSMLQEIKRIKEIMK